MRLDFEEIEELCVPNYDLKHEALVGHELDNDKLRDEILPRDTKRLANHAPFPKESAATSMIDLADRFVVFGSGV